MLSLVLHRFRANWLLVLLSMLALMLSNIYILQVFTEWTREEIGFDQYLMAGLAVNILILLVILEAEHKERFADIRILLDLGYGRGRIYSMILIEVFFLCLLAFFAAIVALTLGLAYEVNYVVLTVAAAQILVGGIFLRVRSIIRLTEE